MTQTREQRLQQHIDALKKAYNNTIKVLNQDPEKDELGNLALSDDKQKNYVDGISKASKTSDELFTMIDQKINELENLQVPQKANKKVKHINPLSQHLE